MRLRGMRTMDIAAELKCQQSAISQTLAEPEVQALIEEGTRQIIRDATHDLKREIPDVIRNLARIAKGEVREGEDPIPAAAQVAAGREFLARAGVGAADRLDVASVAVTDERLAATLSRLRKEIEDDGG